MCVELYRQGKYPETPEGTPKRDFHKMIRKWVRMEDSCGPEVLRHKNQNKEWTAEQRYELVAQVLAGKSIRETAFSAGISDGQLHQWVKRYRIEGYQELVAKRKGRPPKELQMKKKIEPAELTPSEREEMIRLKVGRNRIVRKPRRPHFANHAFQISLGESRHRLLNIQVF